ncbi:MAG: ABC-2 transporter permease [Lachnospiraceae bacterium]|nr:ABC-2 transporter permease [Lachnospiraceae bacterium]
MKGLLYKEFFLGRKNYLAFLALFFVFALLGALVCLSMICGNLQSLPVEDPESVKTFALIFTYAPYALLLAVIFDGAQSVYRDHSCGFMKFTYTLPVKTEVAVGVCYLTELIFLGAGLVLGIINAGIISVLTETAFSAGTVKNMFVILLCAVFVYAWELPLAYRLKNQKTVSAVMVAFCVVVYLVTGAVFISGMKKFEAIMEGGADEAYLQMILEKYAEIRDAAFPFVPFLIAAVLALSFFLSVKICKRREK